MDQWYDPPHVDPATHLVRDRIPRLRLVVVLPTPADLFQGKGVKASQAVGRTVVAIWGIGTDKY